MDTAIRVIVVYVAIYLGLRLMGKREFGQLSPIELISLLLIPELVGPSILAGDHSVTNAFVGAGTLLLVVFAVSALSHLWPRLERVLQTEPAVLVHEGRLIESALNRERISPEEVHGEVRRAGLEHLDQVRWAVLEGDGRISIVPLDRAAGARVEEPVPE